MEPIVLVTVTLGALYIVGRGPLVVAPAATVAVYRRMFSTTGRTRAFGSFLVLLAVALVVTARQARIEYGGATVPVEVMGWLSAAVAVVALLAPGMIQRRVMRSWDAISDPVRQAIGVINIAFGLGIAWFAFVAF